MLSGDGMTMRTHISEKTRLYAIEFLRIFFIFFIILGHIMERYPEIKSGVLSFLHTKEMNTGFGVEFFFIIGGFFLYKRILSPYNTFELIKKIYVRLVPALLFIFLICSVSKTVGFSHFPAILSLCTGLTIPGEITGWGDWYVGVYFWCSLLFIGLFRNNIRQGFLWTAVLCYLTLCLKFNAPYDGWMKTYYTVIGNQVVRGVYSMGIGIVAAYLSDKVKVSKKKGVALFFTAFEVYCCVAIFNYVARSSHSHVNFWEMETLFAALLICIANSLGYVTKYLNKFSKIQLVSRYAYPIFLGHIPFIKFLIQHPDYGFNYTTCGLIILGGAITTGVIEYHLVEKRIVPWVTLYFKKEEA